MDQVMGVKPYQNQNEEEAVKKPETFAFDYSSARRVSKPPGGDCHDIFDSGSNNGGSDFAHRLPSHSPLPHHRVTKPPGGECSDIFKNGATSTPPTTPRRQNRMQSNIFGAPEPLTPRGTRRVDDSFNKLFGEVAITNGKTNGIEPAKVASTPTIASPRVSKDHQKSNIFFVAEKDEGLSSGSVSPVPTLNGSSKIIPGDAHDSASSSGNSSGCVTPSGSATPNESATPNGSVNGDVEPRINGHGISNGVSNGVSNGAHETPKKSRVPPGGHASKLW